MARRLGQEGMGPARRRDENIVSMDEGGTNLLWAERYRPRARDGRALDQDVRPVAHRLLQRPRDDGAGVDRAADDRRRQAVRAVACASTGDTSAALAAYAAAAEIPSIVILPRGKVSTAQLVQPLANGALVLSLDTDFDGCMAIVQRLPAKRASTSRTR